MPGEREQREAERNVDLIEERRADRDLGPLHRLGEDREQGPPQHRKRDADEQEIIEEEARLAAHHRFEPRLGLEQREPP